MRLLFFTRKIDKNDPRVGFVSGWITSFSYEVDFLYILTWQKSRRVDLPSNSQLIQLPKNKILRLIILPFKLLKVLAQVDGVFAHMMPVYSILVGPWCKLFNKKLIQWYTHSAVDWRLKLACIFVDSFVTASAESFRLKTKKQVKVLGHGIETNYFVPVSSYQPVTHSFFKIITVGRISPSKNYELMLVALGRLKEQGLNNIKLQIIGSAELAAEQIYLAKLKKIREQNGLASQVDFMGAISHYQILPYLQLADLFINLSQTGSLDKAVLEAMSTGCLVLTSNIAFKPWLPSELIVANEPQALTRQIKKIINLNFEQKIKIKQQLRQIVVKEHNLENLVKKIVHLYQ